MKKWNNTNISPVTVESSCPPFQSVNPHKHPHSLKLKVNRATRSEQPNDDTILQAKMIKILTRNNNITNTKAKTIPQKQRKLKNSKIQLNGIVFKLNFKYSWIFQAINSKIQCSFQLNYLILSLEILLNL